MNTFIDLTAPIGLVVLLGAALSYWMPRLTRPDLYFAVTVPADFRDGAEGRSILSRYRVWIVLVLLVSLVVLALGGLQDSPALLLVAVIIQLGGALFAYLAARVQVRPYATEPTTVREATLAPRSAHLPGGWLGQAGPLVLLAGTALYLQQHWSEIPERFPIHWGLDGQPNGWASRTPTGVYGPLLIAVVLCLLLAGLGYGTLHASRPIRVSGASGVAESRFRSTVAGVVVGAEYFMALIFAWTALLPLMSPGSAPQGVWVILGCSLVFVIAVTTLLVRLGQGGTRAAKAAREQPALGGALAVGDRTQDRYWKAGLLYVNYEDPALFVEKRFGIGYTLNFGRPASWVMLAALILLPILIAFVVKLGGR